MSFLSNLFRTAPATDEWPTIAGSITSGFQDVKKRWFNECVVAVEFGLFSDKQEKTKADEQEKTKVVNIDLGGAAALAITGYQICCAGNIISRNGYVSKSSTKDFLDLLCSRVSGIDTGKLMSYISRYDSANGEDSTQRFKFGLDVARYITFEEPPMILSLHVASLAEKLFTLTCAVTANAFGDSVRVGRANKNA